MGDTSRDIVIKAIEFDGPERVPMFFPSFGLDKTDIVYLTLFPDLVGWVHGQGGRDEWGCVWKSHDKTMGAVVSHPLSNWGKLQSYKFPLPRDERRFKEVKKRLSGIRPLNKYVMGYVWATLFERMHFLRGFNDLLADLYLNKDKVLLLADEVLEFQKEIVRGWGDVGVDATIFTDDWGDQKSLFIRPTMWREIFKPRYKELFDVVHEEGMHAILHSDGRIYQLIPEFIECGLDVLEVEQPRTLLGIENLGRDFGGKICFMGCVDLQTTMVHGTRDEIRREARLLVEKLGRFNGGFIAEEYTAWNALNISEENVKISYEAFKEFGRYR